MKNRPTIVSLYLFSNRIFNATRVPLTIRKVSCVRDAYVLPIHGARLEWTCAHEIRVCCVFFAVRVEMYVSLFIFLLFTEIGSAKVMFLFQNTNLSGDYNNLFFHKILFFKKRGYINYINLLSFHTTSSLKFPNFLLQVAALEADNGFTV